MDSENELENRLQKLYNNQEFLDIYDNPVVRWIVDISKSIPFYGQFISLGDSLVGKLLSKSFAQKLKIIIEEILKTENPNTNDILNDINSVQAFRQMIMLVDRTNVNEKVRLFARLYKNSYMTNNKIDNDEYEEYLKLLDELSFREIDILIIYNECLGIVDDFKGAIGDLYEFKKFISKVTQKYKLTENQAIDILQRLYSKGLCFFYESNYDNHIHDKTSFTTEYFKKFANRISGI